MSRGARRFLTMFVVEGTAAFPFEVMAAESAYFHDPADAVGIEKPLTATEADERGRPKSVPRNRRVTLVKVTRAEEPPAFGQWLEAGWRVDRGSVRTVG